MNQAASTEKMGFQTEVQQLLHLMIHSLYSNREIFLRELVSNASDALDKLRFQAMESESLYEDQPDLRIRLEFDAEAKTLTISDSGIGMNRTEVIENLGTIARSGTREFLATLTGDRKKDSSLIGQFGVGFYSAFIVADRVEVFTRKAGEPAEQGVHWVSEGKGEFEIGSAEVPDRGTRIILHLKDDATEYASEWRLKSLVKKYSDHISFPVQMAVQRTDEVDAAEDLEDIEQASESADDTDAVGKQVEGASAESTDAGPDSSDAVEFETVNAATALWTLPKGEISDEEYREFYKHIGHDFSDPLVWAHNRVEGKLDYTSLLYVPARAPFDLYNREAPRGLKLYVQRVFIMDDAEQFLPLYLRFIKGVVDTNDLSLNVSRELLQNDKAVESMKTALTKRVLDLLLKLAKDDPEKYREFYKEFGSALKEGPAEDYANREKIAKLLRFSSTNDESGKKETSLEDYVARMREGQNKIYFVTAESRAAGINSPHIEYFRKKGIEVLVMHDRIDEWLMSHLHEFDGKSFQDVAKGKLDADDAETDEEKKQREASEKEAEPLLKRLKEVLAEEVSEVRVTQRLTDSPACLVFNEHDMGVQMKRIMEAAGQKIPDTKPVFEINMEHPLLGRLESAEGERFEELSRVLLDQARLSGGEHLEDPSSFVKRLNKLLLEMSAA